MEFAIDEPIRIQTRVWNNTIRKFELFRMQDSKQASIEIRTDMIFQSLNFDVAVLLGVKRFGIYPLTAP